MAPSTRTNLRLTPPLAPEAIGCWETPKRRDFFYDLEKYSSTKSMRAICRDNKIDERTGRRWKKQQETFGLIAMRRTRGISKKLGRPLKLSKSTCEMLVSKKNPLRRQPYEVMIEELKLPVQKRQLQRKLREYTRGGRRYKCAFVKKVVSAKNRDERKAYGYEHEGKTIDDF